MLTTGLPALTEGNLSQLIVRFALALALGVLVGSERERSTPDRHAPGVRTFAILALVGAAAVVFDPIVLGAAMLATVALAISPTLRQRSEDEDRPGYGATTIAAAATTPLIGALAVALPALAAATGVALVATLASKERVHAFIRQTITDTELTDAVKFFVVALIILPLLPDQTFGPLAVFNPHKVGFLVTALTGIGWIGHIAVRAFGTARGLPLAGLAGGLVSSTATTATMARKARTSALRRPAVAAALLSKVSSLATLALLVGTISPALLHQAAAPLTVMIAVLLVTSRWFGRTTLAGDLTAAEDADTSPSEAARAFALRPALFLAGIITVALVASKAAAAYLGPHAVIAVAALAGIASPQAATLAAADLVRAGSFTAPLAMLAMVAALLTNTVFKIALAYTAGGRKTGRLITVTLIPATLAMTLTAGVVAFLAA